MNLSILTPTVPSRFEKLEKLLNLIKIQLEKFNLFDKIEICVCVDNFQYTIGEKRNILLESAKGKFLVFIDDDDLIHDRYCEIICNIIENKNVDYIGYRMARTFDFVQKPCEYRSIYYKKFCYDEMGHSYRNISHTNPIKSSIAKRFEFPKLNFGEDVNWCEKIYQSKLVTTEHFICDNMYIQQYESKKTFKSLDNNFKKIKNFEFVKLINCENYVKIR